MRQQYYCQLNFLKQKASLRYLCSRILYAYSIKIFHFRANITKYLVQGCWKRSIKVPSAKIRNSCILSYNRVTNLQTGPIFDQATLCCIVLEHSPVSDDLGVEVLRKHSGGCVEAIATSSHGYCHALTRHLYTNRHYETSNAYNHVQLSITKQHHKAHITYKDLDDKRDQRCL